MTLTHAAIVVVALLIAHATGLLGRLLDAVRPATPIPRPSPGDPAHQAVVNLHAILDAKARDVAVSREVERLVETAAAKVTFNHAAPAPAPPAAPPNA